MRGEHNMRWHISSENRFIKKCAYISTCLAASTFMHSEVFKCQERKLYFDYLNPCPAELLQLYFSSFEAGIANAISSFK